MTPKVMSNNPSSAWEEARSIFSAKELRLMSPVRPQPTNLGLRRAYQQLKQPLTDFLVKHSLHALRLSLGVVYLWFGALKLFPGLSPAQEIARRTIAILSFGLVPHGLDMLLLALLECAIGFNFLWGKYPRITLGLMTFQMIGAMAPLVLFPQEVFRVFPIAPTLEGQYILKNLVLLSAAMVLATTVRGGRVR
jgi:hypothetical protein